MTKKQAIQAYRAAFAALSERARRVQNLAAHEAGIDAALLDLEKARTAYNNSRDILASYFLPGPAQLATIDTEFESVRSLAALRWEVAGKPDGTAEDDWYRAEAMVKQAAAA